MSTDAQGQPPPRSAGGKTQKRLGFVDSLRGLAVVFMVPLHTSHGWVRPEARSGELWHVSQFFGGLAAPIFLTLTGVSLGLQWANQEARGQTPNYLRDIGRGLQIMVLGYLLRLQMWVIDAGGYAQPRTYPAQLLLLGAYGLAYYAFGRLAQRPLHKLGLSLVAAGVFAFAMWLVSIYAPQRARNLLRVDVLQCIGVSLVVLSALAALLFSPRDSGFFRAGASRRRLAAALGLPRRKRFGGIAAYLIAALACALLSAWLWPRMPGALPEALAGYFAQWPATDGRPVMGLFPLFPWTAYALAGAAVGLHWGRAASSAGLQTSVVACVVCGAFIALFCGESWPIAHGILNVHGWLELPLRVAYKLGLVLVLSGVALADSVWLAAASRTHAEAPASARALRAAGPSALMILGRASLLVYWVHLEFAFGAASRPFARRLDLFGWAVGSLILLCAMWLIAYVRVIRPRLRFRAQPLASS